MYNRTDKDKHYRLLIEVFENSFFIKITDLEWHKVSMDNIEEVTKIHSAINKFNREIRRWYSSLLLWEVVQEQVLVLS